MLEALRNWFEGAAKTFGEMSIGKRALIAGLGGLLVLAAAGGILVSRHNPYSVLYSDLSGEESAAVLKKLGETKIPYTLSDDKKVVSVPADQMDLARMELAKEGLPGQDVVGFERFDKTSFGVSSYVQRVQYIRSLQGELIRSIQRIDAVKRARVHISIPPKRTFLEDEEAPKASVVVELKRGRELAKAESKGIAHLVSSAVEGLQVNQVTIVDTQGRFLHRPEDEDTQGMSTQVLEMQRSMEKSYEKRIVDLLSPVVGAGKVIAKVAAELDMSRSNTFEESYDPDRTVAQVTIKNDETANGQRPNPLGIPGSRSNLPGSEVNNPPVPMATMNTEKNSQKSNYAVPKKIARVDKPSGSLKRLTVAVVVDGLYKAPAGSTGAERFEPRSDAELTRLQSLVAEAVGIDSERRDSITITSLPFKDNELLPLEEAIPAIEGFSYERLGQNLMKNGLILSVILLFFFSVLRPFLRWATTGDLEKELSLLPKTVGELELAKAQDPALMALSQELSFLDDPEPLEKKEELELVKRVKQKMETSPHKGLHVVSEWVDDELNRET